MKAKEHKLMGKKTVSISIVAANFNNGIYLNDFIKSIQNASVAPLELIIVDDGSTDNSMEVIESYHDLPYLKGIRFEKNRGFCHALNAGIEAATGDYIMRADPDDIIFENRMADQFSFLEEHPDIDVVGSNVIYFDSGTKKKLTASNFPAGHEKIKLEYMKGDHGVLHATVTVRASVLKQYRYNQTNYLFEDYDIFARMIADGHLFANIKHPLVKVRIHKTSAANNVRYSTINHTFKLRDAIFKTSTSRLKIRFYYWYMLNYRRFLSADSVFLKMAYLGLAVVCQPQKLINRIFQ